MQVKSDVPQLKPEVITNSCQLRFAEPSDYLC